MSKQENSDVEVIDVNKIKNLFAVGSAIIGSVALVKTKMNKGISEVEQIEKKATIRSKLFGRASKEERKRMKDEQRQIDAPKIELARYAALGFVKGSSCAAKLSRFAINTVANTVSNRAVKKAKKAKT